MSITYSFHFVARINLLEESVRAVHVGFEARVRACLALVRGNHLHMLIGQWIARKDLGRHTVFVEAVLEVRAVTILVQCAIFGCSAHAAAKLERRIEVARGRPVPHAVLVAHSLARLLLRVHAATHTCLIQNAALAFHVTASTCMRAGASEAASRSGVNVLHGTHVAAVVRQQQLALYCIHALSLILGAEPPVALQRTTRVE